MLFRLKFAHLLSDKDIMFKILVGKKSFDVELKNGSFTINGQPLEWDIQEIGPSRFHIISKNRSYNAEIVMAGQKTKTFIIRLNGRVYPVEVKDQFDILLEKMGLNSPGSTKVNIIKAPMPGLIIDLRVKDGDPVKAGDPLVILEAMKMENIIKSPGDAVVRSVKISKGDSVEKNQVLIEF